MAASGHLQVTWPDHPGTHAEKLIRAADFDGALAAVEKAIAEHPDNSKLLRIKHDALMGARRFNLAVLAIEQALALKPGNSFYRKLHGIALKDAGRFAEALPLLLAASAEKPADVDLLAALCVAHFRLGDEQAALIAASTSSIFWRSKLRSPDPMRRQRRVWAIETSSPSACGAAPGDIAKAQS